MNIEGEMEACIHDYYTKNGKYPEYVTLAPGKIQELHEWASQQSGVDEISASSFKGVEVRSDQHQSEAIVAHGVPGG